MSHARTGLPKNPSVETVRSRGTGQPGLPEKYTVKITVCPSDNPKVNLTAAFEDIARADILRPDFGDGGIAKLVSMLEKSVDWGGR